MDSYASRIPLGDPLIRFLNSATDSYYRALRHRPMCISAKMNNNFGEIGVHLDPKYAINLQRLVRRKLRIRRAPLAIPSTLGILITDKKPPALCEERAGGERASS